MTTTWREWADWFIELYGLSERQTLTVAAWVREVFIPGGCTPQELHTAALTVVRGSPPRFLNEILPALLSAVREARTEELLAREDQERRGGGAVGPPAERCGDCDGSGWAIVPYHPQPERAALKGYLATHAVLCGCDAGRRLSKGSRASMTLAAYEAGNPDWREQSHRWRKRQAAEGKIAGSTAQWDGLCERLIRQAERRVGR